MIAIRQWETTLCKSRVLIGCIAAYKAKSRGDVNISVRLSLFSALSGVLNTLKYFARQQTCNIPAVHIF